MKFQRVTERLVYENKYVQFFDDEVVRPDGSPGTYIRFRYREAETGAVVIPRFSNNEFLLLEVNRYAAGTRSLEFPRGGGKRNESFGETALRELKDETGLQPIRMHFLGYHRPDTSFVTTRVGVVLADLDDGAVPQIEAASNEGIERAVRMSPDALWRTVAEGGIDDGFTLGAMALYQARSVDRSS